MSLSSPDPGPPPPRADTLFRQLARMERRLSRENRARQEAERLLEQKSLELYTLNRNLAQLNASLEQRVEDRTQELERERERALQQAHQDTLTGLPNRLMFQSHMRQVLATAALSGMAVLYLDLDGFKGVNDTLGHPVGDALLRAVADRLRNCTRQTDLVARLGGDEFAIVQVKAQQPSAAAHLSDRLLQSLRAPFLVQGHQIVIGTSIGVALAESPAATADGLLRNADIALYSAKAAGRGAWRLFHPDMDLEMQARRQLETDLRCALADGQFELYYQPLVDAASQGLTGFEALLRWNHPTRGKVSPAEFIPLAEEIGLIRPIGAWVLQKACADAANWPSPLKVAVNLSPVQFRKGTLLQDVEHALTTTGLPARRLELEVTESVLLQQNEATLGILHGLRALGTRISMDDFGTGYSSLSYLHRFPFDKIKIDQSFVRNLAQEKGSLEIIRAVVGLGRALNMEVLAEGVETPEQLRMLQAEGCDELQGYLFSRPLPLPDARLAIASRLNPAGALRGPAAVSPAGECQQLRQVMPDR
jgi:diguanylate cyclase (GGDEF)-like protein